MDVNLKGTSRGYPFDFYKALRLQFYISLRSPRAFGDLLLKSSTVITVAPHLPSPSDQVQAS